MAARRPQGTGSIIDKNGVYYGQWRDAGRLVKRRIGPIRSPHKPDGLTKGQAEARLRDLIREVAASAPVAHARTLEAAADAWLEHLEANGTKASSVRAYRAALDRWFLPTLRTRSLDRIATRVYGCAARGTARPRRSRGRSPGDQSGPCRCPTRSPAACCAC